MVDCTIKEVSGGGVRVKYSHVCLQTHTNPKF